MGICNFAATIAPANVELTSPTTNTKSGFSLIYTFSSFIIVFPVCSPCNPAFMLKL